MERVLFVTFVFSIIALSALLSCGGAPENSPEKPGTAEQAQGSGAETGQGEEAGSPAALVPCDGPGVDPWVAGLRDRVLSSDMLANYAAKLYGPSVSCEGAVTSEFDGAKFGTVRLGFSQGVTFTAETMPPETSIVTVRSPAGFENEASARKALGAYCASVGLRIDWTAPNETTEGEERVQRFWDPDPGVNGSASLYFREGVLVAIRFSMAL